MNISNWLCRRIFFVVCLTLVAIGCSDDDSSIASESDNDPNMQALRSQDMQPAIDPVAMEPNGSTRQQDPSSTTPSMEPKDNEIAGPNADVPCIPVEMDGLETCCKEDAAHCVPTDAIGPGFRGLVGECDAGGLCVPDSILRARGSIELPACKSVGDAEGVCVSKCVPKVAEQAALLPQDVCTSGEVCVPCISPLTNEETGVCGRIDCSPSDGPEGMSPTEPEPEPPASTGYSCENPPQDPIADPGAFPSCCPGARCIPAAGIPESERTLLAECDDGNGYCVPDKIISNGGFIPPATCTAAGGAEGRCMSTCLPLIAERAHLLSAEGCDANERCTPCCDPLTGMPSGVCEVGCDTGAVEACDEPIRCCAGHGTCVTVGTVPDGQRSSVKNCRREGHRELLCLPNEFFDPNWAPTGCTGNGVGGAYDGVCLPDCLKLPLEILLDATACADGFVCAPCIGPFGQPTGAPGCPQ